jgi:ubiquinone/menaquinone biosynthesis C-methylase UbiE
MLKSVLDRVMDRRSRQLMEQVREVLPTEGSVLDLGSGTGHFSEHLARETRLDIVPADVSDMHVRGRPPVLITDGPLPFEDARFSAALLLFVLAYPQDPSRVLAEAARVTRHDGSVILVQTLYSGRIGYAWHRLREFCWTVAAFHVSKLVGYVPTGARFTMRTRRYYTAPALERAIAMANLRVRSRRERPVLPRRALVVAAWVLERDV